MNEKKTFSIMECFTSIRIYMLLTFHYVFYLVYRYGLSFKIFLLYAFYNSFIGSGFE